MTKKPTIKGMIPSNINKKTEKKGKAIKKMQRLDNHGQTAKRTQTLNYHGQTVKKPQALNYHGQTTKNPQTLNYHGQTAKRTQALNYHGQMGRKKQPGRKSQTAKRPKAGLLEILLFGGITAMIIAIMISLFSYFHPFTWEDVKHFASACIDNVIQKKNGSSNQDAAGQILPEETKSSYLNHTTDLGNIADFTSEPVFPEQNDSIYSFIMDTSLGPMLYYNQGDLRWKSYLYGGTDPLSKYGCGPVCVAMIINSFGTSSVSPIETADWAAENGCFARNGGSYHNLIPDSLTAFGLQVESVTDRTAENAAALLRSGHLLVALMGKGSLTNNGHFIIITQLTPSGNVYIADPASYENCTKEWNLQQLMEELKQSYDSGGPLWAVTMGE